MSLYELTWFFFIYGACGWIVEVIYAAIKHGKFVNRGFLNGPICPIYGVGMAIVILLLNPLKKNFFALYFGSLILTSLIELVTGFLLAKIFNARWWDYSDEHFNIGGYVCLKFSLLWGMACVIIIDRIHPVFERLVSHFHSLFAYIILSILIFAMIIDIADTVAQILKIRNRLKSITEMGQMLREMSNNLGNNIAKGALDFKTNTEPEKLKADYEETKAAYNELLGKRLHGKRLIKSFPEFTPGNYKDAFSELKNEIDSKKKNKK